MNAAGTSFYRTLPPRWLPPSESPDRGTVHPPLLFLITAKCGVQDELSLRTATLKVRFTVRLNLVVQATYGASQKPTYGVSLVLNGTISCA